MGQQNVDAFLRFYVVPGLQHCALGPGANDIGQFLDCRTCDAQHDINMALARWVELGVAPTAIIATRYRNDLLRTDPVGTRPVCPYPQVASYKGSGSIDDAANFVCQAPKQ
jgi:feruloyl esterase